MGKKSFQQKWLNYFIVNSIIAQLKIIALWTKNDFLKPIIKCSVQTFPCDYTSLFFFGCASLLSVEFMLNM